MKEDISELATRAYWDMHALRMDPELAIRFLENRDTGRRTCHGRGTASVGASHMEG